MQDVINMTTHTAMISTVASSAIGWIPMFLAIPAAIWYCLLIYDWFKKRTKKDGK